MSSWEHLLDLEKEKNVVSYLNSVQLFLLFILQYLSTGNKFWLLSLGPICLLPHEILWILFVQGNIFILI